MHPAPDTSPPHRALPPGWRWRDARGAGVLALAGVELVYLSDFVQSVPWKADVGWVALGAVVLLSLIHI